MYRLKRLLDRVQEDKVKMMFVFLSTSVVASTQPSGKRNVLSISDYGGAERTTMRLRGEYGTPGVLPSPFPSLSPSRALSVFSSLYSRLRRHPQ